MTTMIKAAALLMSLSFTANARDVQETPTTTQNDNPLADATLDRIYADLSEVLGPSDAYAIVEFERLTQLSETRELDADEAWLFRALEYRTRMIERTRANELAEVERRWQSER